MSRTVKRRGIAVGIAAAVIGAVGSGIVAGSRRLRRYRIAEHSMTPTLEQGDFVVALAMDGAPARGEIVVFPHPHRPDFEMVKRVVGLAGETVTISGGQVQVDGRILAEPWVDGPTLPDGRWDVGADEMFVLGDRRNLSTEDSRMLGPVPAPASRWRIVGRYWPPQTMGVIRPD